MDQNDTYKGNFSTKNGSPPSALCFVCSERYIPHTKKILERLWFLRICHCVRSQFTACQNTAKIKSAGTTKGHNSTLPFQSQISRDTAGFLFLRCCRLQGSCQLCFLRTFGLQLLGLLGRDHFMLLNHKRNRLSASLLSKRKKLKVSERMALP